MDAFYASVEQRDHPDLRGRPVIVGASPQGRGVVSAASYEAREYGVRSAMPSAQAKRLCPEAAFLPVRMARYHEVSRQVMALLAEYTPLLEQISVDEAFLDVTGSQRLFGDAESIGRDIKRRIQAELQLTASVGIAASKFVAKVASDLHKPDGLVVVEEGKDEEFLRPLPISRLWGVGKATEQRLHQLGMRTIGQLAAYDPSLLKRQLGAVGQRLHELAHGIDNRPLETEREAKSVSAEHTFQEDTNDPETLERTLLALSEDVGARLRRASIRGRTIQLKVRFSDFRTITRSHTLAEPSDATDTIHSTATGLLWKAITANHRIRLLGVAVSNLREPVQRSLFDAETTTHSALDDALDDLRERFGRDKIKRGRLVDDEEPPS
jgi:DNA polymerase-4